MCVPSGQWSIHWVVWCLWRICWRFAMRENSGPAFTRQVLLAKHGTTLLGLSLSVLLLEVFHGSIPKHRNSCVLSQLGFILFLPGRFVMTQWNWPLLRVLCMGFRIVSFCLENPLCKVGRCFFTFILHTHIELKNLIEVLANRKTHGSSGRIRSQVVLFESKASVM